MTFCVRNLSVLAYANGFTLWHYNASADTRAEMCERGFFDAGADMLADGDIVLVSSSDGGGMWHVRSDAAGLVVEPAR